MAQVSADSAADTSHAETDPRVLEKLDAGSASLRTAFFHISARKCRKNAIMPTPQLPTDTMRHSAIAAGGCTLS